MFYQTVALGRFALASLILNWYSKTKIVRPRCLSDGQILYYYMFMNMTRRVSGLCGTLNYCTRTGADLEYFDRGGDAQIINCIMIFES